MSDEKVNEELTSKEEEELDNNLAKGAAAILGLGFGLYNLNKAKKEKEKNKKENIIFGVVLLLAALMFATNPEPKIHKENILSYISRNNNVGFLDSIILAVNNSFDYQNYYVVSFGGFKHVEFGSREKETFFSVGVLGKVFVVDKKNIK